MTIKTYFPAPFLSEFCNVKKHLELNVQDLSRVTFKELENHRAAYGVKEYQILEIDESTADEFRKSGIEFEILAITTM